MEKDEDEEGREKEVREGQGKVLKDEDEEEMKEDRGCMEEDTSEERRRRMR